MGIFRRKRAMITVAQMLDLLRADRLEYAEKCFRKVIELHPGATFIPLTSFSAVTTLSILDLRGLADRSQLFVVDDKVLRLRNA